MTQPKLYGAVVAVRLPEWTIEGLDRMIRPGEKRSDVLRRVLGSAVLSAETDEEWL